MSTILTCADSTGRVKMKLDEDIADRRFIVETYFKQEVATYAYTIEDTRREFFSWDEVPEGVRFDNYKQDKLLEAVCYFNKRVFSELNIGNWRKSNEL